MRSTLKSALERMDSDEFLDELEAMTPNERNQAALTRGETFRTWRRLNNQQLDEIRQQLEANETELRLATGALQKALANVEKVAAMLETTNRLLRIVARVFTLVG